MQPGDITIYGAFWCGDCRRAKKFMDERGVLYTWIDIDHHPDAVVEVERLNRGMRSIPTIVFADGSILVEPSNAELARKLGIA
ncbi:MAG: NrdH-redoxin [Chloroflexia bacterium]|nr:NrdH-redoxin [Chloroflexia bacterium]